MSERKTKFCVNCGAEIDVNASFCTKYGAKTAVPVSPQTWQAGTTFKAKGKPKIGLIASLLGALIIFIAAIVYLAKGNAAVGIVGILLVFATVIFARMGYLTPEKKSQQLYGAIPMFIGFFIMIVTGTLLNFDIAVLSGGFILTIGGVLISAGK